jgi:hypothetical protein
MMSDVDISSSWCQRAEAQIHRLGFPGGITVVLFDRSKSFETEICKASASFSILPIEGFRAPRSKSEM